MALKYRALVCGPSLLASSRSLQFRNLCLRKQYSVSFKIHREKRWCYHVLSLIYYSNLIYSKINHTIPSIDLKKCLQILIQITEILLGLTSLKICFFLDVISY